MPAHTNHAVNQRCNCCSCCPGLACWRQMDRHIDYKLQQAGTIDPAPYLRNWRSQAQKICNWGTMILKPRTCACSHKPCGKPTSSCNCCSCCPGLACWRQMDRHIDYKLQQAGTIDPAPSLRNWRSQAQKICNWGTMILKPRTCACSHKPCGKPTLQLLFMLPWTCMLEANGPTY